MKITTTLAACLLATCAFAPTAQAQSDRVVLVTPDEAQRPEAPKGDLSFRAGVSRGPSITLVSPAPSDTKVQSPVRLELKFEGRGGAQVDVDSLKMVYVKSPAVDLTSRIKAYAKPAGINVPAAELPPGSHTIRAEIKDKDGRAGFFSFNLNVAK